MSQNDHNIANANGATVRADINSALQALASNNGGSSAPSTTYPNQWWFDTTNDILKIRDEANANWVNAFSLVGTTWVPYSNGSVLGTLANLTASGIGSNLVMSAGKNWQGALTSISSGSVDFATSGNAVSVSGTATANSLGTTQAGFIGVIHYAVALTVTHNATSRILNNNGANIPAAVGDVEIVLSLGSGNYRTVAYTKADGTQLGGPQVLAKTANYTVTDADRGALIRFSGLGADVTLSLPAASGRSGFFFYLANDDTALNPWGVVVDPNSTELLDGISTRRAGAQARLMIICDGTGWRTAAGRWRFISAAQTLTVGGSLTLAHGLGVRPAKVKCYYKCATADLNYSVGDYLEVPAFFPEANMGGASIVPDATNLNIRIGDIAGWIPNKTTGAAGSATAARWNMIYVAED